MNTIQTNIRVKSFDVLKLFAIFLVLWGHSIQYLTSGDFVDKPVYVYIYSFHMPLFMMIAGYFALSSMDLPLIAFVKKKFVQLLLPCLSWVSLFIGTVFISRSLRGLTFPFVDMMLVQIGNFWFLKSLFFCYLIAYLGRRCLPNTYCWVALTLFAVQIFDNYNLPIMYPCFLIGMCLKSNDSLWQKNSVALFVCSLLLFIVLLLFWNKSFWDYVAFSFYTVFIKQEYYPSIFLYREIYRILIGVAGSLGFIFLFYLLFKHKRHSKLFDVCCEWGKYTLGVYILQTFILEIIMAKVINLDCLGFVSFNFIAAPLLSVCVLMVCVLIIRMINKFRILSFLLLGNHYNVCNRISDG